LGNSNLLPHYCSISNVDQGKNLLASKSKHPEHKFLCSFSCSAPNRPFIYHVFSSIDSVSSWPVASFQNRSYWDSRVLFWDTRKHRVFEPFHTLPVHLLGKTDCLRLEDTVSSRIKNRALYYCLSRICFEMTRQFTKTRARQAVLLMTRWTGQSVNCSSAQEDSLSSYRRHGVFAYQKQSATVSVGSVLRWCASSRRHAQDKLSWWWADEQAKSVNCSSAREDSLSSSRRHGVLAYQKQSTILLYYRALLSQ
jgi:hypothetical protein